VLLEDLHVGGLFTRVDDDHPALVELEVALDQGQRAAADGAKADHDDRAGNFGIYRVVLFRHSFLLWKATKARGL